MARDPVEFEVDGLTFEFKQPPLSETCRSLEIVMAVLDKAGAGGETLQDKLIGALRQSIGKLPELVQMFAAFCKVEGPGIGSGRRVNLPAFAGDVFDGRLDRAVLFVFNCILVEHADFLSEKLDGLAEELGAAVARFPSLTARIRSSGGSLSVPK
jgi:hypothetical protein